MSPSEILSIIVTVIGVFSFATIFTILYKSYANSQIAELNSGKKDIELIDEVIYEKQEKVRRRRKDNWNYTYSCLLCYYGGTYSIVYFFID